MESKYIQLSKTVLKVNTGADAIKKAPIVEYDTGIKCLRIGDVSQCREYEDWGFSKVEDKFFENFKLVKDDILIARTGNTIGVNLIVKSNNIKSVFNNGLIRLKIDTENYNPTYIYYIISSNEFQSYIQSIAFGTSTQPNMKIDDLLRYKIKYLERNIQDKIADILSAFDDKIELNNQMNRTLESMATVLFKEWFENFNFPNDEGKAYKEDGGEFKSSELGEIPVAWEVKKLSDISENISRRFKLKEYENVVFVNTGDVLNGEFLHKEYKSPEGLPGQAKKAIKEGDILYSEIRPKNRRFARVDINVNDYVVSTKFMVIKKNDKIGYNCLYIFLTLDSTIEEINTIAESRSGTFPQITFDSISNIKIALPNDNLIMEKFENIVIPIFEQIKLNKEQNKTLKKQRDTLLPKLMSGEIRV